MNLYLLDNNLRLDGWPAGRLDGELDRRLDGRFDGGLDGKLNGGLDGGLNDNIDKEYSTVYSVTTLFWLAVFFRTE